MRRRKSAFMGISALSSIWIYLCANFLGGFFAVAICKLIHSDEWISGVPRQAARTE